MTTRIYIAIVAAAALLFVPACDIDINIPDIPTDETGGAADEDPCEVGQESCECFEGQFCAAGLGCVDAVCVPCSLGGEGCDCYGDGTCEPGLTCEPGSLFCRDAG